MVRPGLSRAVSMGIVGFMVGALLVIVVRALQNTLPLWDTGVGIVFGGFFACGFFIWGMGGFDPRLSLHGEAAAHLPPETDLDAAPPPVILSHSMWQIVFGVVLLLLALGAMAWLGPALITTAEGDASVNLIGMVPLTIGNTEIVVSQLTIFAIFVIVMLVSLALAAGLIGWLISNLSRGLVESRVPVTGTLPSGERVTVTPRPRWLSLGVFIAGFVVLFAILYLLFYYVLIGLVMPNPPGGLTLVSAVNALLFTVLILRPRWIISLVSRVAGWLAGVLRSRSKPYEGVRKIERGKRP